MTGTTAATTPSSGPCPCTRTACGSTAWKLPRTPLEAPRAASAGTGGDDALFAHAAALPGAAPRLAAESAAESAVVAYTSAMQACTKGGEWRLALQVLDRMAARGVAADAHTLSVALVACRQGGAGARASSLLRGLLRRRDAAPPSAQMFVNAMTACNRAGEWGEALELFALRRECRGVRGVRRELSRRSHHRLPRPRISRVGVKHTTGPELFQAELSDLQRFAGLESLDLRSELLLFFHVLLALLGQFPILLL